MGRRTNGEGSIYEVANGKFVARIQVGWRDNGKPKIKSFTADSKAKALKRMQQYINDNNAKEALDEWNDNMENCLNKWLNQYKICNLKASSFDRLSCTVRNNIVPYIGDYHIQDITSAIIQQEVINELFNKGLSHSTVKKAYDALNDFYKLLINEGSINKKPMVSVKLPSINKFSVRKDNQKVLSFDEIKRFEVTASEMCKSVDKPVYRHGFGYIFILYTGLRCSEALGLQYKHINFETHELVVNQSMVYVVDRKRGSKDPKYKMLLQKNTKTSGSTRVIPICKKAYEAICRHRDLYYNGDDNEFVFQTGNGTAMRTRNFERSVNYIFKAAGINATGLHVLRHSFASMLFAQRDIDIKYISELLGHSDVHVTYRHYIFTMNEKKKEYLNILDNL